MTEIYYVTRKYGRKPIDGRVFYVMIEAQAFKSHLESMNCNVEFKLRREEVIDAQK